MGLRQIKDYARKWTGAEDVDSIDKGITKEMLVANSNYINRKKEEAERLLGKSRKREVLKKKRKKGEKQQNKQRKPKVILTKEKKIGKRQEKCGRTIFSSTKDDATCQ